MRSRPRTAVALTALTALAALSLPPASASAAASGTDGARERLTPGRQVITRQQIQEAGISRIGEILFLADQWAISTLDGFTWWAAPGGLAPFEGQDWAVMVDGAPVSLELFDTKNLSRLPFSITQVDSVEILSTPGLHHGRITDRGLVHIHTGRPPAGLSAAGSYFRGNESGEPGPYKYVPSLATPNVDKQGPDYTGVASFAGADTALWVEAAVKGQFHFATDPRIFPRIRHVYGSGGPKHRHLAWSLRLDPLPGSWVEGIMAGRSRIEEHHFWLNVWGNEFPATALLETGSITGGGRAVGTRLSYSLAYSGNELSYYSNAWQMRPDYRRDELQGRLEGSRSFGPLAVNLGYRQHNWLERSGRWIAKEQWRGVGHLYGALRTRLGAGWSGEVVGDLGLQSSATGGTALARLQRTLKASALALSGSYTERLIGEDPASWVSWGLRGYGFLAGAGSSAYAGPARLSAEAIRHSVLDLEYRRRPCDCLEAVVGASYRRVHGAVVPIHRYAWELPDSIVIARPNKSMVAYAPHHLYTGVRGHLFGARATLAARPAPSLRWSASYRYVNGKSGDWQFEELWKNVPMHTAHLRVTWRPAPSFHIYASANWQSATDWVQYLGAATTSDGFYDRNVDPQIWLDAAVGKSFFEERVRLDFAFRNLADRRLYWHPIGGDYSNLSFQTHLRVRLDSLWVPGRER